MADQTVTRAIESGSAPGLIYSILTNALLMPKWAPVFADKVEHAQGTSFRATKGNKTFDLDVLSNDASLSVDYLFQMAEGRRGGAYIRVIPRPLGGSVITMTVPIGPGATTIEVAQGLDNELEMLISFVERERGKSNFSGWGTR